MQRPQRLPLARGRSRASRRAPRHARQPRGDASRPAGARGVPGSTMADTLAYSMATFLPVAGKSVPSLNS